MMYSRQLAVGTLVIIGLSGCAMQKNQGNSAKVGAASVIQENLSEAAEKIQLSQAELYQAGMLSQRGLRRPVRVGADLQPVSTNWSGDAQQLLKKLASDRGIDFYMTGVEQPLPVVIKVENKPYDQVVQMVQAQVGYRAQITQNLDALALKYQRPDTPLR
ncbi:DotD/TraH family lipoprotein [Halomonas elongata]|uniref:DotD/TraH family lipoprotein n=1 Tax=Halomonas elongata TaxID=2746 RepID=UPI00255AC5C3|nr:DotD/TraH family lipoprotein [Halomonas elongata]MDL4860768.1 DotD/TraH family lipoprotein [Halomonas elongata]